MYIAYVGIFFTGNLWWSFSIDIIKEQRRLKKERYSIYGLLPLQN